ncbi:MAG: GrpB family protein [Phyllobacteriaceae bacterium]|nr:GrpB family protein [Phyllobacteriaceae bacterium]
MPHDPAWAKAFELEVGAICRGLGGSIIELHHIGSTSIPGILAKPVIDMLGIVEELSIVDQQTSVFRSLEYEVLGEHGIEGRRYFRKSAGHGHRTHHLHVYKFGHPNIERHVAFRDYLRSHPDKAKQYSDLKVQIIAARSMTSSQYMEAKHPFIMETLTAALQWYRNPPITCSNLR